MKGGNMFTGIVEEVGTIRHISEGGTSGVISIRAKKVLEGTKIGDSIAVSGICLTVTSLQPDGFTADVMAETVRRTALAGLTGGSLVNLERAMLMNGRFGGHIVSGHIDGTGVIESFVREENAVWVTIRTEPEILHIIVEKGSIAIDGISLTVAYVDDEVFKISMIPHTGEETTLLSRKVGDVVNLENDVIGKYVEKLLNPAEKPESSHALTMEYLMEQGF
jgi:riboflavin synthase